MTLQKICPNCHNVTSPEATFCGVCGTNLKDEQALEIRQCPNCGAVLKTTARFCTKSGMSLEAGGGVPATVVQGSVAAETAYQTPLQPEGCPPVNTSAPDPSYEQPFQQEGYRQVVTGGDLKGLDRIIHNYLSFDGRLNRWPYFYRGFVFCGVALAMVMACVALMAIFSNNSDIVAGLIVLVIMLCGLIGILSIVCGLSLSARRCHDLNHSAAMVLLFFVPFVDFFFGLYLIFMPGTAGPNQYGPDPVVYGN